MFTNSDIGIFKHLNCAVILINFDLQFITEDNLILAITECAIKEKI